MKILAFESSCDETAAAVVENGRTVLSSVVATQIEQHKLFGGVVPEIASRMHTEAISAVCAEALEKANCTLENIDAIANFSFSFVVTVSFLSDKYTSLK